MFDATARNGIASLTEKQDMPACLPLVSFSGDERASMTDQDLRQEIDGMWAEMREAGAMVIDAKTNKVGMPTAVPYEGVCFPVEIDGEFLMVSIPVDQVERFALGLAHELPFAKALEQEHEAQYNAHEAICKAKGY